ncbi:DNA helicase MCM8-like isoform X2 [Calliopsis andreniformis]|uniref:DNA helicase MCM8-like isoform X2 n=1 Tax=Calliopsis andreniformis TaxID=337506 RepID=UPI003FCDA40A
MKILGTVPKTNLTSPMSIINSLSTVRLKILNCESVVCLQDLKTNFYGKLVSVRGSVIRVGHVKHIAEWTVFVCRKCNLQKIVKQPQGIYTVPKKCSLCGTSKFRAILDAPQMKTVFFQTLKIQEFLNDDQNNRGGMPRVFDVELMDYLVNTCIPGDDITVTGIIKGASNTKSRKKVSFSLYMEAVTIINNKQRFQSRNSMDNEMSMRDYITIQKIYNTSNIFPLLVHSLCPTIYGHEMIKAGLLLSLFGGNPEHSKRDSIHTLLVGDPGLGKSQMLQACSKVAMKGVYVCGNTSTSSGLTITLTKGSKTSNFTLEPGALVLADKGCCCIDEFDKMSKQYAALLESMEQQCVSVAKSGIVCSLPTRTSILAAANPINGRFNRSKTLIKNLKMTPPLLSRFDLIFLLIDEPNEHEDDLLCKHVMLYHTRKNIINKAQINIHQHTDTSIIDGSSLRSRLASSVNENISALPQSVLQKYISYARRYVKPKLTKEAAAMLQDYYLELRKRKDKCGGLCIYNRKLEAMIRLTEARAKLELRTEATEVDAADVIELLRYTFDKISCWQVVGNNRRTTGKLDGFIQLLRKETFFDRQKTFTMESLREIALTGKFATKNFSQFISKLNEQGILLQTGSNTFKFVP